MTPITFKVTETFRHFPLSFVNKSTVKQVRHTYFSLKLTWSAERATAPHRHISGYTGKRNLSSLWDWLKKITNQIYIGAKVSQYGWPKFWTVRQKNISTFHHMRVKQHLLVSMFSGFEIWEWPLRHPTKHQFMNSHFLQWDKGVK